MMRYIWKVLTFTIAGVTGTADITDVVMTGGDDDVNIALEYGTDDRQAGRLVQDTAANEMIDSMWKIIPVTLLYTHKLDRLRVLLLY